MPTYPTKTLGFTLLELMATVVIIAIFAVIAIPSYQYFIAKSRKAQAQAEMQKISERLENYRGKQLNYAGFIPDKQASGQKGVVYLPNGSSSTSFDYQIYVADINYIYDASDTTKATPLFQALEDSTIGQGWRIIAIPSQTKSSALSKMDSLFMDSRGTRCATTSLLTKVSNSCPSSKEW